MAAVAGMLVGYALLSRKPKNNFLALAEYWVYLRTPQIPTQEAAMDRMIQANPYRLKGRSPIGAPEGLVFSDIRLHIAVVRRERSPQAFRPDLFESFIEPTATQLAELSECVALVKLRYASEEPLKDRRHLRFLAHAADAYAELAESSLIFDGSSAQLLDRSELVARLTADPDATGAGLHVRSVWISEGIESRLETRGMQKVGLPELKTQPVPRDEQWIVKEVFEAIAKQVWDAGTTDSEVRVSAYDDTFLAQFTALPKESRVLVRIHRMQAT